MTKSLVGLTRNFVVLLRVMVVLNLAWLPVQAFTYYSYARVSPNLDYMESDLLLADRIALWIGLPLFVASIAASVVYFIWLFRAVTNLRTTSPDVMTTTPGWALGWYLIPVASWFAPYRTMRQVWTASHAGEKVGHGLVKAWWITVLMWIVSLGVIASDEPTTVGEYLHLLPQEFPSDVMGVVLSILTLALVSRIGDAYEHNVPEWQLDKPSAPAGWYPDPQGSGKHRFWTGNAWDILEDEVTP